MEDAQNSLMGLAQLLMQRKKQKMMQGQYSLQNILNTGGQVDQAQAEKMNKDAGMPKGYLQSISGAVVKQPEGEPEQISAEEYDKRFGQGGTQLNYNVGSQRQRDADVDIQKAEQMIPIHGETSYAQHKGVLNATIEAQPEMTAAEIAKEKALGPIRAETAGQTHKQQLLAGLDKEVVAGEANKMSTLADQMEADIARNWDAAHGRKMQEKQDESDILLQKAVTLEGVKGKRQMAVEGYKQQGKQALESQKN
jgi:hypothetical protein